MLLICFVQCCCLFILLDSFCFISISIGISKNMCIWVIFIILHAHYHSFFSSSWFSFHSFFSLAIFKLCIPAIVYKSIQTHPTVVSTANTYTLICSLGDERFWLCFQNVDQTLSKQPNTNDNGIVVDWFATFSFSYFVFWQINKHRKRHKNEAL